jgi:hypothetical protein
LIDFRFRPTSSLIITDETCHKIFLKFLPENFDKGNKWLTRLIKKLNQTSGKSQPGTKFSWVWDRTMDNPTPKPGCQARGELWKKPVLPTI